VDTGKGRLADPAEIVDLARLLLAEPAALPRDLVGRRVLITAGGTREPLDPVRYLGNRSSGKQGYALARVAAQRGAEVTLIAAHTVALPDPAGVTVEHVSTAEELRVAVHQASPGHDVVVMAAAVADFRPAGRAEHKIKKSDDRPDPVITLTRNADILAELVQNRASGQVVVGFAAETGDERGSVLDHARAKLKRKGCDLLVVNAVGEGRLGAKAQLAAALWDAVAGLILD